MKPLRSTAYQIGHLLNPLTPYVCSAKTDIAQTFARIRELQELERARQEHARVNALIERTPGIVRLKR